MFTQLVHLTVVWSLNHWNRESYIFELEFEFEFELDFELDFELQKKKLSSIYRLVGKNVAWRA